LVFAAGPFHLILHLLQAYFTRAWYFLLGHFTRYCTCCWFISLGLGICCWTISLNIAFAVELFHQHLQLLQRHFTTNCQVISPAGWGFYWLRGSVAAAKADVFEKMILPWE
jgi:hypothetical protein